MTPLPHRLNLGCGFDTRPGYLNVDFVERHKPDLVADVTSLPMLPSGWFEEILAVDVLEHIERTKTETVLAEWRRLLAPEGHMHIRVPSLLHLASLLLAPQNRNVKSADDLIQYLYGTQAYTGDYHLTGFTAATLERHLANVGLYASAVTIKDGWLFEIAASRDPGRPVEWHEPISEIEALYRSTSWRVTAPLRAIKDLAMRIAAAVRPHPRS